MSKVYDIFVIGGGINGCGIARDAAGRGYSVHLVEMNDLGSGTSSWSSKLIHGGFRYLEHYEFRLVREALSEREVLLKMAPHIIWPMRFILPHHKGMRPAWLLRLGLFLYDHIGTRVLLPASSMIDLANSKVGKPLKSMFSKGFEYSDCWVNDVRLVILNAMDAAERGAKIETHTQCISAHREEDHWSIVTRNNETGVEKTSKAKLIVNAAGPWVDKVLGSAFGSNQANNVRLVQGSHIVVPKLFDHDQAYIFQNSDGRIIFVLPYEQDYTLIGTTDQDYEGDPKDVKITPEEVSYLCEAASEYFVKPISPQSIVWSYSGVRPLFDDGATAAQEATRDYVIREDGHGNSPRAFNIFGGKITTYRKLSETMLSKIENVLGAQKAAWTKGSTLPGGEFEVSGFSDLLSKVRTKNSFLSTSQSERLVRSYGSKAFEILESVNSSTDMGEEFGHGLTEVEVKYLINNEWAQTADDVLWRRSKLGIRFSKKQQAHLEDFMTKNKRLQRLKRSKA
ncbi:MAG: glycerol-3-phosphate dehydrogenase [Nitratireductor sp.]